MTENSWINLDICNFSSLAGHRRTKKRCSGISCSRKKLMKQSKRYERSYLQSLVERIMKQTDRVHRNLFVRNFNIHDFCLACLQASNGVLYGLIESPPRDESSSQSQGRSRTTSADLKSIANKSVLHRVIIRHIKFSVAPKRAR